MLLVPTVSVSVSAEGVPNREGYLERVAELSVGSGASNVAYYLGHGEPKGPDSFGVDAEGTIFVLDGIEKAIEVSAAGKYKRTIDLSFATEPNVIALAEDGTLYVLDTGGTVPVVFELSHDGALRQAHRVGSKADLRGLSGLSVDRNGKVWLQIAGTQQIGLSDAVSGQGGNTTGQTPQGSQQPLRMQPASGGVLVSEGATQFSIKFQGTGAVKPLGRDRSGTLHVEALDMVQGDMAAGEMTLRKFSPKGEQVGIVKLPETKMAYVPKSNFTTLGLDGFAYVLRPGKETVQVLRIVYGDKITSSFNDLQAHANQVFQESRKAESPVTGQSQIGPTVTESDAQYRANRMIQDDWWFENFNRTPNNSTLRPPDWLASTGTGWKTGIPYNWGGFDSRWSSSMPYRWVTFIDAINKGKYAGNVLTTGGYKADTAGLDCSGLVSVAWMLGGKVGTYSIRDDRGLTWAISRDQMRPMDAAVNYDHVVLMNYYDVSGIGTAEATLTGPDKAQFGFRYWSYLSANSYVYRQYVNMQRSDPRPCAAVGGLCAPASAASMETDRTQ